MSFFKNNIPAQRWYLFHIKSLHLNIEKLKYYLEWPDLVSFRHIMYKSKKHLKERLFSPSHCVLAILGLNKSFDLATIFAHYFLDCNGSLWTSRLWPHDKAFHRGCNGFSPILYKFSRTVEIQHCHCCDSKNFFSTKKVFANNAFLP